MVGATLARWFVSAAAIWLVAALGWGIEVRSFWTAAVAAVVLGLVDLVVRPILVFLTFPITLITLGLFWFVLNGVLLLLVGALVPGFKVKGLVGAIVASIAIGIAVFFIRIALRLVWPQLAI